MERTIVVLDTDSSGDRRLLETVHGSGMAGIEVDTLDALAAALRTRGRVGVVAFESLWPDPQRSLRGLRDKAPNARLVVAHADDSPRLRLGQRLWSIGLCDYFVPRSSPPHEMTPILRQAYADALIEGSIEEGASDDPSLARLFNRIRFLHAVNAGLTNQRRIDGLVRELHMKLPQLFEYAVLEVMIAGETENKLYVFQTRAVEHELTWKLAEELCVAVAPFCETQLTPEDLEFVDSPPTSPEADTATTSSSCAVPIVFCGQLVGGIAVASTTTEITNEFQAILQLIGYQLATSLRNAQALEAAESDSLVDELTGTYNRRYMKRALAAEWRRASRYGVSLSCAMLDIDHFKKINDSHGHLIGDEVLRSFASRLRQQLRDTDHLVRYGGEEFLLLLPETSLRETMLVLERIRLLLKRTPMITTAAAGPLLITVSAGIAAYPGCAARSGEELIHLADEALLRAKRSGRDRVCLASEEKFDTLALDATPNDKRRFSRIRSSLPVRFVELPEFEGRTFTMSATDVSAGGIAVQGSKAHLKKNAYALVYLGDEQKPLLSQVMWTRDHASDERSAGLQFVSADAIASAAPRSTTTRKGLVVAHDPATSATIERVMRAAHYDVHVASDASEIAAEKLSEYSLLVLGESSLRSELGNQLQRLREQGGPALRIALVNESQDRRLALDTIRAQHADHLIPKSSSEDTLFATLSKLVLEEYFGLKKYLLWGAETRSWTLTSSIEKAAVLDGVKGLAADVKCHPRIADLLVSAVDEMIINALFRPQTLAPGQAARPVTVECGSDGRFLGVAVLDEHGLFRDEDLFRGIGKALEHEQKGISEDAPHAHLGFRIMLSTLSHLVINVDPGRCTEIIGLVDLRMTLRELRAAVPSLGLFTNNGKR